MKNFKLVLMCVSIAPLMAMAQVPPPPPPNRPPPPGTTPTTQPTPGVGVPQNGLVQDAASGGSSQGTTGVLLGVGATAFATYKATLACAAQEYTACTWWTLGAVAAGVVTINMAGSRDKAKSGYNAVTVPNPSFAGNPGGGGGGGSDIGDLSRNPAWNEVEEDFDELRRLGYGIDLGNGIVTLPNGRKINVASLRTESGMRSAGISDTKGFQDFMKQMEKAGEEYASNAADQTPTSAFDDTIAGGGGGSGFAPAGGYETAVESTPADPRAPAAVKGLKKLLNGEPIGTQIDSLFDMMHARYKLHEEKGTFITPSSPAGP